MNVYKKNYMEMNKIQMTPLQLVIKAYNWVGYKYTEQDAEFMVNALTNLLNSSWKRYKIKEVDYFITLGLNGVFGNFAGISMATLCQFETSYQKNDNVHYRKEYLRLNPPEQLVELVSNTESGKDEVVINSILSKLRNNTANEADYNVWFAFLENKGAVNSRSWQKFIYNKEDDYEPAKERYLLELGIRKRFYESIYNFELLCIINKEIQNVYNNQPDIKEIEFWSKVLFFEDLSSDDEKINRLEQFLKQK